MVQALRVFTLGLLFALAAPSCGGETADSPSGAGGGGGTQNGTDPWDLVTLPPDVEAPVRELVNELGKSLCEQSRECCPVYGLRPLPSASDCTNWASVQLLWSVFSAVGNADPSSFDYTLDEKLAEACVTAVRGMTNDCVFSRTLDRDINA